MNDKGIKDGIRRRVESLPDDSAFTATDFADIAESDSIRRAFKEMADAGQIARAARGVYYKPRFSDLLGRTVPPDVDAVAEAVARARGWTIAPSGDHALNRMGLDTQVPAVYAYISTGPYTSISVEPFEVKFKHAANKDLVGMSHSTLLVVQALKALGKDRIDDDVVARIAKRLSPDEKKTLLDETQRSTDWIRRVARRIAEGEPK